MTTWHLIIFSLLVTYRHAHTRTHAHTHTHAYRHTHSCMYTQIHAYMCTHAHPHPHTHAYMHTQSCLHTCTHTHACMHAYTDTCAHMHERCTELYLNTFLGNCFGNRLTNFRQKRSFKNLISDNHVEKASPFNRSVFGAAGNP